MGEFPPKNNDMQESNPYWDGRRFGESDEEFAKRQAAEAERAAAERAAAEQARQEQEQQRLREREAAAAAEAALERERESARVAAEQMRSPSMKAEVLVDGGGQTRIDLGRYHEWLDANAQPSQSRIISALSGADRVQYDEIMQQRYLAKEPGDTGYEDRMRKLDRQREAILARSRANLMTQPAYERMSSGEIAAVDRAEQAVRVFDNAYTEEQRQAYLKSGGDVTTLLGENASAEELQAAEREMGFLRSEGFLIPKDDTNELMIDPDFAALEAAGDDGRPELKANTAENWFDNLTRQEKIDIYWQSASEAERDAKLAEELPDANLRKQYQEQAAKISELRNQWYESLPTDEKDELLNQSLDKLVAGAQLEGEAAEYKKQQYKEAFLAGGEEAQKRWLWNISEDKTKFGDLPEDLQTKYTIADKRLARVSREWVEGLDEAQLEERKAAFLADYEAAVQDWNKIPVERRRDFLQNGELADLAGQSKEDFDAGSDEGRKLVSTLARLETIGAMQFNQETRAQDAAEVNAYRDNYREKKEDIETNEESQEKANEKLNDDELKRIELVKKHRTTELQQMIDEKPELFSANHDEAMEEAAYLSLMKNDQDAWDYETKMLQLKRRQEKSEGAADYEGETQTRYQVLDENNESYLGFTDSKAEAEKIAGQHEGSYVREQHIDTIDFENDSEEEQIRKMKWLYPNKNNLSVEDYNADIREKLALARETAAQGDEKDEDAAAREQAREWLRDEDFAAFIAEKDKRRVEERLGGAPEHQQLGANELRDQMLTTMTKDEIAALRQEFESGEAGNTGETEPAEDETAEERPVGDGGKEDLLYELRHNAEEVKGLLGRDPEAGRSIAEIPDEEVEKILQEIAEARQLRDEFVAKMAADDGFRRFVTDRSYELGHRVELQTAISGDAVRKLNRAYEKATAGEIIAVSTDVSEDAETTARILAEKLFDGEMERSGRIGRFLKGKVFEKQTRNSYYRKAKAFIESDGKRMHGVLKDATNADELIKAYWLERDATRGFLDAYAGKEGATLLATESMAVYGMAEDDNGEAYVYREEEGAKQRLDEADPMTRTVMGLESAYEDYANSNGSDEAKIRFRTVVEELGLGEQMRKDNFLQSAEALRQSVGYGRSVENIMTGFRFINGENGRSAERMALNEALMQRRERAKPPVEHKPELEQARYDRVVGRLEAVIGNLRNTAGDDEEAVEQKRQTAIASMGYAKMLVDHDLVRYGIESEDERNEIDRLMEQGYDALGSRRAESEALVLTAEDYFEMDSNGYEGRDFSIELSEGRVEELSGGNGAYLEEAINSWNNKGTRMQYEAMMTGRGVDGSVLYLASLGLVRLTVGESRYETPDGVKIERNRDGNVKIDTYEGVTEDSLSTVVEVSDHDIDIALKEAESQRGAEEVKSAIEQWNAAPEAERRVYLMSLKGRGAESVQVSDETRAAGEVLSGVFLQRADSYAATALRGYRNKPARALMSMTDWRKPNGDEINSLDDIREERKLWAEATPATRRALLQGERTDANGAAISDELVNAYDVLDEVGMVDQAMLNARNVAIRPKFMEAYLAVERWKQLSQEEREEAINGSIVLDINDLAAGLGRQATQRRERNRETWLALAAVGVTPERALIVKQ